MESAIPLFFFADSQSSLCFPASPQNLTLISLDEVLNLPPVLGGYATEKTSNVAEVLASVGLVEALEALEGVSRASVAFPFLSFFP